MLLKKYGWGFHFYEAGKIALYGIESPEYKQFMEQKGGDLKLLNAMRNSRKNEYKNDFNAKSSPIIRAGILPAFLCGEMPLI
ncbi:DUF6157 family protein [Metabacillus idriensis]|uniref:DUF6157 family protein n=1 Tax=Metabacillus idriensis TaxID=324768 RepID=UPI00174DBFD5|nr:DUF6157 family protein [Metabacillus idriensis]